MSTYTQILYQIVFSTKDREKTLIKDGRERLFRFISGIIKNNQSHLYRINGIEDHLHIVTHLHPSVALANFVKDIKVASSKMIKDENLFPHFIGWQTGYSGFTYSMDAKDNLIEYVKNQEEHHKKVTSKEELISLLREHNIEFDSKYLE
ncbi:MAG: IS200/IS605 family transposase [Saprospiraceae bacterium]|nr:IS200/IS605 family transposase [Saprospiraceae bacterium]